MRSRRGRWVAGLTFGVFVLGAVPSLLADEAQKRELKLAKCAATYKTALSACEKLDNAEACYIQADRDDRACREAEGAAGNSKVDPDITRKRAEVISAFKKPLDCGSGPNATCADGHARVPICSANGEQSSASSQGIQPSTLLKVIEDDNGTADRCTGQRLRCPSGFTLIARAGQDLCWDSVENRNKYRY